MATEKDFDEFRVSSDGYNLKKDESYVNAKGEYVEGDIEDNEVNLDGWLSKIEKELLNSSDEENDMNFLKGWTPITLKELINMSDEERSKILSVTWHDREYRCRKIGIVDLKIKPISGVYDVEYHDFNGDPHFEINDINAKIYNIAGVNDRWCYGLFKKIGNTFENYSKNEEKNYMFFSNLETIKNAVDSLLSMDKKQVDKILENGHAWATDHIATSKDDIEEVANFLKNYKG